MDRELLQVGDHLLESGTIAMTPATTEPVGEDVARTIGSYGQGMTLGEHELGGLWCIDTDHDLTDGWVIGTVAGVGIGDVMLTEIETEILLVTMQDNTGTNLTLRGEAFVTHVTTTEARTADYGDDAMLGDEVFTNHLGFIDQLKLSGVGSESENVIFLVAPRIDDLALDEQSGCATTESRTYRVAVEAVAMVVVEAGCVFDALGFGAAPSSTGEFATLDKTNRIFLKAFGADDIAGVLAPDVITEGSFA